MKGTRVMVAGSVPPPIGGIASYVEAVLRFEFGPAIELLHVDTRKPDGNRRNPVVWVVGALVVVLRVLVAVARHRPDVVHLHTSAGAAFLEKSLTALAIRAMGGRTIMHIHASTLDSFYREGGRFRRWYVRRSLRACDLVIALSASWKQFLVGEVGLEPARVALLRNGVPVRAELPARRGMADHEECTVVFLGVVEERKGVEELVRAVARLVERGRQFRLIMAGPDRDEGRSIARYRQLAESLGTGDAVRWIGPVTGYAKQATLDGADGFVLPSRAEGLPLALLEAMEAGLACVATTVGGIPELMQDEANGLLIPPRDVDALERALDRLITDAELRDRLGRGARATVEQGWSSAGMFRSLEELYHRFGRDAGAVPAATVEA